MFSYTLEFNNSFNPKGALALLMLRGQNPRRIVFEQSHNRKWIVKTKLDLTSMGTVGWHGE
jgi:hypothetical protein